MLADYAVRVEHSRGRRHHEPQHPYRNDFQRDRDRVIHARAFRRLEANSDAATQKLSLPVELVVRRSCGCPD